MRRALLCLALTPLLLPAADDPKKAAEAVNGLKQLGIAMHNHHDAYGYFPSPAICDKKGKPLLSWRVAILPYIEEDKLYKQFKLDEAWDSAHNKKLLAKMPKIYGGKTVKKDDPEPGGGAAYDTPYQVFTGPGTPFPTLDAKLHLRNITDGTSNTFMIGESSKAVPWTKPEDIAVTAKALPKLGGRFEKMFHVTMFDGSTRKVKRAAEEKTLREWISPNGGEIPDTKVFLE